MKTKGPHQTPTPRHPFVDVPEGQQLAGVIAATMAWIQQGLCGLHGHDALLQYERTRIFLRCVSCGHETAGWDLSRTPAPARAEAHTQPAAAASFAKVA